MRKHLQRTAYLVTGAVLAFAAAVWEAVLLIQGILGLSAMPDDLAATENTVQAFFGWLLQQDPNTASFAMAGVLFLLGLFMVAHALTNPWKEESRPAGIQRTTEDDLDTATLPRTQTRARSYFANEDVTLTDLIYPFDRLIHGKTFDSCGIYGPAVIAIGGRVELRFWEILGEQDNNAILLELEPGHRLAGTITLADCTFTGCTFKGITFAGTKETLANLRRDLEASDARSDQSSDTASP
jgi:hypothetical protein